MLNASDCFDRYGLPLLLRFEGLYLKPYLCPAGVPTIGLGSTLYENGASVSMLDAPISRDRAISIAKTTYIRDYYNKALALCPTIDTDQRMAAIVDFAYNLGVGALAASTMRKRINANDWESAKKEILRWDKANGKQLAGLTIRRQTEGGML